MYLDTEDDNNERKPVVKEDILHKILYKFTKYKIDLILKNVNRSIAPKSDVIDVVSLLH